MTADVINANTGKVILTIVVPQGQSWIRQPFTCDPKLRLSIKASFTPVIWANDQGKTYPATQDWVLPDVIKKGDTAWNINVCYAAQFNTVPIPPDSNGQCKCSMDKIPAVESQ